MENPERAYDRGLSRRVKVMLFYLVISKRFAVVFQKYNQKILCELRVKNGNLRVWFAFAYKANNLEFIGNPILVFR